MPSIQGYLRFEASIRPTSCKTQSKGLMATAVFFDDDLAGTWGRVGDISDFEWFYFFGEHPSCFAGWGHYFVYY